MISPKVSVITFAYANAVNGRLELLEECLQSVKTQNYPAYEHIIIDDGSDSSLEELADRFPNTRLIRKRGSGILSSTFTFNLGHQLATSEYCIYLPSDDMHMPGAIASLVDALEQAPDASMAIGKAIYEKDGEITNTWSPSPEKIENFLAEGNYVNGCAVMWRRTREILDLLPPVYTGFCSDYDFWCTLSKLGSIVYPDVDVVKYRHAMDSTRNKTKGLFIASPRKEDQLFYQYTKPARLEFVVNRYSQSIEKMAVKYLEPEPAEYLGEINISVDTDFSSVVPLVKKRKWQEAHESLMQISASYANEARSINGDTVGTGLTGTLLVTELNIMSIVFMQAKKEDYFYAIRSDGYRHNWLFDFLPIPCVKTVLNGDGQIDEQLMEYLGILF